MKQKGFTLIELLVVIVIIGILATISTATFSGYFSKARDTERQTFINDAHTVILAEAVTQETFDYAFGGTNSTDIEANIKQILSDQGLLIPSAKNGINYYYAHGNTSAGPEYPASEFLLFACKEDTLGQTLSPSEYAFIKTSVTDSIETYSSGPFDIGRTYATAYGCDTTLIDPNFGHGYNSTTFPVGPALRSWPVINLSD